MTYKIRPARTTDAAQINEIRRQPAVMMYTLGIPSERRERSEQFLAGVSEWNHLFVAVSSDDDNQILGIGGLQVNPNPRLRHSGSIGLSVHEGYHNMGIGRALMLALIDLGDNWLMLKRLELTVFIDNARAIHLYESLGFEKEGIKKAAAIRNGSYVDEFMMGRIR